MHLSKFQNELYVSYARLERIWNRQKVIHISSGLIRLRKHFNMIEEECRDEKSYVQLVIIYSWAVEIDRLDRELKNK